MDKWKQLEALQKFFDILHCRWVKNIAQKKHLTTVVESAYFRKRSKQLASR